jgi:hypothetical protein
MLDATLPLDGHYPYHRRRVGRLAETLARGRRARSGPLLTLIGWKLALPGHAAVGFDEAAGGAVWGQCGGVDDYLGAF